MKFLKLLIVSVVLFLPLQVQAQSQVQVTATVSTCGDGIVTSPVEDCEGLDLNGGTCASEGFTTGFLSCTPSCTFETSQCITVSPPITAPPSSSGASGSRHPAPVVIDQSKLCSYPQYILTQECLDADPETLPVPPNCLPSPVPGFLTCTQENPIDIDGLPVINQPDIFSPISNIPFDEPSILEENTTEESDSKVPPSLIEAGAANFCEPQNFLYLNLVYILIFISWFALKNRKLNPNLINNLAVTITGLLSIISVASVAVCSAWNVVPLLLGLLFSRQLLTRRW